ncbi:long-chain fatty acid--CoA ligase [Candidatus Dependentiae bacterium]|nr:long-chain fatty acid--CoA ligase [Candidatus Dependentiae bacterium]
MSFLHQVQSLIGNGSLDQEQKLFEQIKASCMINGELMFVGDLLLQAYQKYPDKVALHAPDRMITFFQLYALAQQVAKVFRQHGVKARNRVIIYYENSIEFYIGYYAAWMLHAVATPVNTYLHAKELAHVIKDSDSKVIFTQPSFVAVLEGLVTDGFISALPHILTHDVIDWSVTRPSEVIVPDERLTPDDLALLLYTSGTTGVPKGVMLSSRNALTNALQAYPRFRSVGLVDGERFFCVLPLFHAFAQVACIWIAALTGSTVIIVPRIDRKLILEGLQKQPTVFFGFPALYGLLCLMKTAPLDTIKLFVSGADALPDKIRSGFAMIYGRRICSGYGLTEASPVVAINTDNEERPTNEVGNPVCGIDLQLRDDNGVVVKKGEVGTLWIKGDNIMLGYYRSQEATAQILVDGWLNTGDLVSVDELGRIAIRGRSKDLIIHKGFNIYPQEIENVLLKHPNVFKAAVVGKAEDISGQIPVAYVAVRSADHKMTEEGLRKLCNEYLAAYKVPRQIICLDDLPMNATGKVDKKQLRQ